MANYLTLVEQLSTAVDQLNEVLQGDENTTVTINDQQQPSVQKKTLDEVNAKIQLVLDAAADIDAVKYGTTAAGIAATTDGQFFSVVSPDDDKYLDLYKNESNVAVFEKSYPSISIVSTLKESINSTTSQLSSLFGERENLSTANNLIESFIIQKSDGQLGASSYWSVTNYHPVLENSVITRDALILAGGNSDAASIAFYDIDENYLGFYDNQYKTEKVLVSDHFINAKYIRFSVAKDDINPVCTISNLVPAGNVEGLQDYYLKIAKLSEFKEAEYYNQPLVNGFIARSDGSFTAAENWRTTEQFIPAVVNQEYTFTAVASPTVAGVSFYDEQFNFIGYLPTQGRYESYKFEITDVNIKYIKTSAPASPSPSLKLDMLTIKPETIEGYESLSLENSNHKELLNDLYEQAALEYDYTTQLLSGFLNLTGDIVPADNWGVTEFIDCKVGDIFTYTGERSESTINIGLYDKDKKFISSAPEVQQGYTDLRYTITSSNVKYIRASFRTPEQLTVKMTGPKFELRDKYKPKKSAELSVFAPNEAYATVGEPIYLISRGIVGNTDVQLAWNLQSTNEEVAKVVPVNSDDIDVKLAYINSDNQRETVCNFSIKVSENIVSPSVAQNFVCLGDSLTLGVSSSGIEGAYPNELSRRLTGLGHELLPGPQSPAPKNLTNIYFRGTLGDKVVKHEGRGGWTAANYLNSGDISNAFYNPSSGSFDLNYYITENGFDTGEGAISSDGSNLTIIILLGWNDVYKTGPTGAISDITALVNKIKADKLNVKVLLVGLNPAPELNSKSFTGERFVSQREVFEVAIKQFGNAYRDFAKSTSNCDFLQISHVFNPEFAYPTATVPLGGRTSETVEVVTDHVHPDARGYAQIADALYYKILYDYCQ